MKRLFSKSCVSSASVATLTAMAIAAIAAGASIPNGNPVTANPDGSLRSPANFHLADSGGGSGTNGAPGRDGTNGSNGTDGVAATIAIGTVTTGAPGSSATVTNTGTSNAAVLGFNIPRGDTGATGAQGLKGDTGDAGVAGAKGDKGDAGVAGTAATIATGTVTTGSPGSIAIFTNVGTSNAASFNITIPRGDTGATGATGAQGPAGIAATNAAYATNAGSAAYATNSGFATNAGSVTGLSVASGKTATISNSLTFVGTDGSTLSIGPGGTLGSAAYTSSSIYAQLSGTNTFSAQNIFGSITTSAGCTFGGNSTVNGILNVGSNSYITLVGKIRLTPGSTDGNLVLSNNTASGFGLLQFGAATSSFPAIKRSATGLIMRLADDSSDTWTEASNFNPTSAQTSVSGTSSGAALFTMPFAGTTFKMVFIHLAALSGTASWTYSTAFSNAPHEVDGLGLATSISNTTVTVTGSTTTGDIILVGN